jgi:MarR family transcriptional regulator, organic hydroperoxide resistance regulator
MFRHEIIRYGNICQRGYRKNVGTTAQTGIAGGRAPAAPTPEGIAPGGARTPEVAVHDARACLAAEDLTSGPCSALAGAKNDLTWLLHRCAQRMRGALDEVAREHGLTGARDWIVLSAIAAGPRQTQLALAQSLGLDKTTMTSLLDRLESAGLVTRYQDSRDRRARIPQLTETGNRLQRELITIRDRAEAAALSQFSADEQRVLRAMLNRLAEGPADDQKATGSCM